MDDFDGRTAAKRLRLYVVGTIGSLVRAAELNLIVLADSLNKLRQTNFFATTELFAASLDRERSEGKRAIENKNAATFFRLTRTTAEDGHRMQTLITEIDTSYPFTHRRIKESRERMISSSN
jgi:hypothetical protein